MRKQTELLSLTFDVDFWAEILAFYEHFCIFRSSLSSVTLLHEDKQIRVCLTEKRRILKYFRILGAKAQAMSPRVV